MTAGIEFNQDGMPIDTVAPEAGQTQAPESVLGAQSAETESSATGNAIGNDSMYAPPQGPHAYEFTVTRDFTPSDADFAEEIEIRQALHEESFPTFAAAVVDQALANIVRSAQREGLNIYAGESGVAHCTAELTRRHGAQARALIADAGKTFAQLDARNPKIGDLLANTGAGNVPEVVELLGRLWRDVYSHRQ